MYHGALGKKKKDRQDKATQRAASMLDFLSTPL